MIEVIMRVDARVARAGLIREVIYPLSHAIPNDAAAAVIIDTSTGPRVLGFPPRPVPTSVDVLLGRSGTIAPRRDRSRLDELARMPYEEYLRAPEWRERRDEMLRRADRKCQICSSSSRLEVHHSTYDRRGREFERDLLVLCDECHELFHSAGRLRR